MGGSLHPREDRHDGVCKLRQGSAQGLEGADAFESSDSEKVAEYAQFLVKFQITEL
jgi:hypothetical protein